MTNDLGLYAAIRADVDAYPGRQDELSQMVCGSPAALRHKLTSFKGSVFKPEELVMLMQATGSRHTITAMAREVGGVFLQLPPDAADLDPADLAAECQAVTLKLAAMFAEIGGAVANDGQIDANERERIEQASHALREQVMRYLQLSFRLYEPREP